MPKTRSQQRAEVQDAVITAARRLFVEKGYKETTMADISIASGIHIGSIYNIFRDKEDIVCEIAVRAARVLSAEGRRLLGEPTAGGCMLFPSAETLTLASYNPRFARLMCVAYSSAKTTEVGLELQRTNYVKSLGARGIEFDQDEVMSTLCACNGAMAGILTRYCDSPRPDIRKDLMILARVYGSLLGTPRDPEKAVDAVLRLVEEHPPETLLLGSMDPEEFDALRRGDGVASRGAPTIRRAASSNRSDPAGRRSWTATSSPLRPPPRKRLPNSCRGSSRLSHTPADAWNRTPRAGSPDPSPAPPACRRSRRRSRRSDSAHRGPGPRPPRRRNGPKRRPA